MKIPIFNSIYDRERNKRITTNKIDLKNLIITSEAVTRAALLREESRGAHTRLDFEGEREEGLSYNIIIKKTEQGMQAEKIKRKSPPQELENIAHASLKELEGKKIGA